MRLWLRPRGLHLAAAHNEILQHLGSLLNPSKITGCLRSINWWFGFRNRISPYITVCIHVNYHHFAFSIMILQYSVITWASLILQIGDVKSTLTFRRSKNRTKESAEHGDSRNKIWSMARNLTNPIASPRASDFTGGWFGSQTNLTWIGFLVVIWWWLKQNWRVAGYCWLVVWTPLKNISQLGWLFPIYGKKNVPNHQPDWVTVLLDVPIGPCNIEQTLGEIEPRRLGIESSRMPELDGNIYRTTLMLRVLIYIFCSWLMKYLTLSEC